jgi:TolB-like protein/predicted Zn-dependent protease
MDAVLGLSSSPEQSMKLAEECARKALSLNPMEPKALLLVCRISQLKKDYDKAIEYAEKAVKANPNNPYAFYFLGFSSMFVGRSEEAIANIRKAMRLTPHYPPHFLDFLAYSLFFQRRYDEALPVGEKILERGRKGEYAAWIGYILMIAIYSELGQEEKARNYATEFLAANPNWTLQVIGKIWPFKEQSYLNRLLIAGRKAGLPDKPPKAGLPDKPPLPLPDKPSIAVLAFDNLTGDPEQEYFSDGITEAIINGLSKIPNLFVIARKSSFTYKGKQVKVQQVSKELGVRYVLEGSVQRSGDRVRITVQLVDAIKGHHLWSNSYDRDLKDIFTLQDEIMMKIMTALRVKLTEGEQARVWAKGVKNVQAYLKLLKGTEYYIKRSPTNNKLAQQFFKEVIEIDPESSVAYAFLSYTHIYDRIFRTGKDMKKSLQDAFEMAEKALTLDESNPDAHLALSWARMHNREHDMSIAAAERGVALSPNYALANRRLGVSLMFSERSAEAIPWIKKAMRLNPFDKAIAPASLGLAYWSSGQYDVGISVLKEVVRENPNFFQGHYYLALNYASSGQEEEARAEMKETLRINPKLSLKGVRKRLPMKKQSDRDRWLEALRKAGLK